MFDSKPLQSLKVVQNIYNNGMRRFYVMGQRIFMLCRRTIFTQERVDVASELVMKCTLNNIHMNVLWVLLKVLIRVRYHKIFCSISFADICETLHISC